MTTGAAEMASPVSFRGFGVSSDGADGGVATARQLVATLDRKMTVVNFYDAWAWGHDFPTDRVAAIAALPAVPEITWEPWDPRAGIDQPTYSLAKIAGGAFDDYITTFARGAARYGHPLYLRFAHEMNGTWYPWAVGVGGTASEYIAAFRHVHDLFERAGATQVRFIYSPNVVLHNDSWRLTESYPGKAYVDVIGVDGYNFGNDARCGGRWQTPQEVFGNTLQVIANLSSPRPVWITETGTANTGGDPSAWVLDLFTYLASTQVTTVVWFNFDLGNCRNWQLTGRPGLLAAAKRGLAQW
jgi:beta-mannanase